MLPEPDHTVISARLDDGLISTASHPFLLRGLSCMKIFHRNVLIIPGSELAASMVWRSVHKKNVIRDLIDVGGDRHFNWGMAW
jgi:hypothetical protein